MKMEKKNDLSFNHYCKLLDWKKTKSDVKACLAYFVDGKEIFRDEVKLYSAKDRERFARECFLRDGSQALDETLESLEWMIANFDLFEEGQKNKEDPPSNLIEPSQPNIDPPSLSDVYAALSKLSSSPHS